MKVIPIYATDLIAALDKSYPPRCRRLDESERDHDQYAGKRALVDYLLELHQVTEGRALKDQLNVQNTQNARSKGR